MSAKKHKPRRSSVCCVTRSAASKHDCAYVSPGVSLFDELGIVDKG